MSKNKNTRILPIEEIQQRVQWLLPDVIQVGYEQAGCNDERMVDHEDAVRILMDDLALGGDLMDVCQESMSLLGTMLKIRSAAAWEREFPNSVAVGF